MFRYLSVSKPPAVPLLSLRILVNMFSHEDGARLNLKHHGEVLVRVRDSLPILPKPNQKQAVATLLLNYAIAANKHR